MFELNYLLASFLKQHRAGKGATELRHIYVPEDRVYLPYISFIASDRLPPPDQDPVATVPDFVIEVLSPDDRAGRVIEKVQFYLRAGVRLLWIVDPDREVVTIYRPGEAPEESGRGSTISADPVLPGFSVDLEALFAPLSADRES